MEEWAVAALIGAAAGYGIRFWQEKMPDVVKGPAEATVRTVGSALDAGVGMGGRAVGMGGRAVGMGGRAAGAGLRAAMRRVGGQGQAGKQLTRVPVSDGGRSRPSRGRPRRAGSTTAGSTARSRRTGGQARSPRS